MRRLLDDAGAILVGKVYSQIGRGDSIVDCCNPWDVTRSPGTSSSGSGSAVAARTGAAVDWNGHGRVGAASGQQLQPGGHSGDVRAHQPSRGTGAFVVARPGGAADADG